MEKVITINNRDETLAFGEYLGKLLKPHMLLTLMVIWVQAKQPLLKE